MHIQLISPRRGLANTLREVVRLFFPAGQVSEEPGGWASLRLVIHEEREWGRVEAHFTEAPDSDPALGEAGGEVDPADGNTLKRLVRLAVYRALVNAKGEKPGPWGILTGVRPTKIVHRLRDRGYGEQDILRIMTEGYEVSEEKVALLNEVTARQRPQLPSREEARRRVSVYVGIPFCPTRCLYCSFPAYPIRGSAKLVAPYLTALGQEIAAVGEALSERGMIVESLYLGGGTPTSLEAADLAWLVAELNRQFRQEGLKEFTVEGGRPDTLDWERLRILQEAGVDRLSINPQTLEGETLKLIGRHHTPEEVEEALVRAKDLGFRTINMDLILGLPGETVAVVERTLQAIKRFRPENLTVHTLSVKRASRLTEEREKWELAAAREVEAMQNVTWDFTRRVGYLPYYLYRQKQILANLENVGYCLPGHLGIYNIQVMEERQTIIGLGAGATSKWVDPFDWTLVSTANPKDPQNYIERLEEVIERKREKLDKFTACIAD